MVLRPLSDTKYFSKMFALPVQSLSWITMFVVRSIFGIVAGYFTFGASAFLLFRIADRNPHAPQDSTFVLLAILFGMTFAALGGFIAAWIARRRPILHAAVLAGIIALGALVSMISSPGEESRWSQLSAIGLMAPGAIFGGIVKAKRSGKR